MTKSKNEIVVIENKIKSLKEEVKQTTNSVGYKGDDYIGGKTRRKRTKNMKRRQSRKN